MSVESYAVAHQRQDRHVKWLAVVAAMVAVLVAARRHV